jgi:Spy/CpxP family protein refolding chaperone
MPKTTYLATFVLVALTAGTALALGASSYAGQQVRPIKALSAEETRDLLEGRGMGLAKAAELNRYPGPMHVMELAKELRLSESAVAKVRAVFEPMRAEAQAIGREIVAAEERLDRLFASGHADVDKVSTLTTEIGALQGKLRAVHLNAHLAIRPMLESETVARYDALRGYAGEPTRDHAPGANPHRH